MHILRFLPVQLLSLIISFSLLTESKASLPQDLQFKVITLAPQDLTDISRLGVTEAMEKNSIKVPDLQIENSPALEKIKLSLDCAEKTDKEVLKGSFGLVRTTQSFAFKLSVPAVTPLQEVANIICLRKSLAKSSVKGLTLCIPSVIYSFRCESEKLGVEPYCVHIMHRIVPQASMQEIIQKAACKNTPLDLHYIEMFCRGVGQMQAASLAKPKPQQLVCDTHFDLSASNIMVTKSFTAKTKPEFTIIDCADFARGSSPDAAPVSVDILYFFLRSSEYAFKAPVEGNPKKVIDCVNRYAIAVFKGYFSSFNKKQIVDLEPIFTTKLAFQLFEKHSKWGYNKKFEYEQILPTIINVFREAKNALPQQVKKNEEESRLKAEKKAKEQPKKSQDKASKNDDNIFVPKQFFGK